MTLAQKALAGLLFAALFLGLGYLWGSHREAPVEPVYAPEERTAPNDVVLETKPGGKPTSPAPHKPAGGTTTSTTEITIDPPDVLVPETPAVGGVCPEQVVECPPVKVRLDLGERDGQPYMAVYAPDGTEVDGQFLPVKPSDYLRSKRVSVFVRDTENYSAAFTKDTGRWSYGAATWSVEGQKAYGIGGSFAF